MIARPTAILFAGLWMTSSLSGVAIRTDLMDIAVFQTGRFANTERLDLNSDGTWDVEFYAHDNTFRISTNTSVEVIARPAPPPNLGGNIEPFDTGAIIGADSPSDGFVWFAGDPSFYSCALFGEFLGCIGLWGNGVNHLGFRIEEEDGFHYGYLTVDTPYLGFHGGFIRELGYESSPDTAIQIPEPSSTWLILVAMSVGVFKRRRRLP